MLSTPANSSNTGNTGTADLPGQPGYLRADAARVSKPARGIQVLGNLLIIAGLLLLLGIGGW